MKALLLIGGQSTRMGMEKYLIDVNGKTQYHHLHQLLTSLGLDVCVSCNLEQYRSLPESHYKLVDQYDSIGPMGGLVAAINHNPEESWLVVACDLVNLTKNTITHLMKAADKEYDIITYQRSDSPHLETTITIYNPSSFRELLDAVETGIYGLQRVLQKCKVKTIRPDDDDELKNVNKPEDLE
ncbi:MAG: molybdenum cofactor guanylyltransferase [Marinoscillum sp.]